MTFEIDAGKDAEEDGFDSWWEKKLKLKQHIKDTCSSYGSSTNFSIPNLPLEFYNEKHKLFNCRNSKVISSLD